MLIYIDVFKLILKNLFRNILEVFRSKYLIWHFLAIGLTYFLVMSGFDWWYFEHTRSVILREYTLPSAIIGFFVPILLPVIFYAFGESRKNVFLQKVGVALAQSAIVAWIVSSTYKAFTGRIQPEFYTYLSNFDNSHAFNFGFWQHGIFWGWPSSHTAVAFAMMVSLILFFPKSKLIKILALTYAFFIGIGVSISIHWFSDFVAGAIFGTLIGVVIFKNLSRVNVPR